MNPITRFFQRLSFSLGAYKFQRKQSLQLFPQYLANNAKWVMTGNENYISEGFLLNAVVYGAIMYKVRAAQAATFGAFTGSLQQKEPLPADHPLSRLLDRPNPWQSFIELDAESRVFFNIFGNTYIYFKRGRDGYPTEFFNLPPYRIQHVYDRKELKGYLYIQPGGTIRNAQPIDKRDMMHVRLPNPADPFVGQGKGASPLMPAGRSVDVDNVLTSYLKQYVDYGAMPPGLFTLTEEVGEEEAAGYRERIMDVLGGAHRWTEPLILGGGAKYQALGSKLNELASNILDARNENRTAMVLGVPLPLIQTNPQIVQSTYSNLKEYERFFWHNTMIPELRYFGTEYRFFLRGEDGSFPAYDVSTVPILRDAQDEHAKHILEGGKSGFFTRAEVKEAFGEPWDPIGDAVYLMPFNVQIIPALPAQAGDDTGGAESVEDEQQRDEEAPETEQEEEQETDGEKSVKRTNYTDEQRASFYKQFDTTAQLFEEPAERAAELAFRQDERNILAILNKAKSDAYSEAKSVSWSTEWSDIEQYLEGEGIENWQEKFDPVFDAVTAATAERLSTTFGIDFDLPNVCLLYTSPSPRD